MKTLRLVLVGCFFTFLAAPAAAEPAAPFDARLYQTGANFLNRIRLADPDYNVVLIACLKGEELNLLFRRTVSEAHIETVLKGLLAQLSKESPGRAWSVVGFRPVVPLRESGIARLNPQTGEILYFSATNAVVR